MNLIPPFLRQATLFKKQSINQTTRTNYQTELNRYRENVPPVLDGDDAGFVLSDAEEDGLSQIEVMLRRITPTSGVVGLSKVGRTKVCSGDGDCSSETPFWVVYAFYLKTSTAALAAVE